jgi:LEA14-like dessication related protein
MAAFMEAIIRSPVRYVLIVAGVMALTACGLTRFEAPHLSVIKVDMVDSDLLSQRFKVRLRVQNPNDRELPVRGVSVKLELAGEQFGDGVSGERFVVPAYGEAEFDMLLTTNLASAVMRYLGKKDKGEDSVDYRLSGNVDIDKAMLHSIPFSDSGKLPIH